MSTVSGAACIVVALVAGGAQARPGDVPPQTWDLKAGQEVTLPISIADGHVALGPARPSKLGTARPGPGEITVGLTPGDKTLHAQILVVEKTEAPIDFVATGLNGSVKIDEAVVCGDLSAPTSTRIGSVPWRVKLNQFEIGKGAACK